jgi:hypothetical protein
MAEAEKESKAGSWDTTLVFVAVIATGAALLVIIAWVIYMSFRNGGVGNFASVATLILVGLAAFIGIMNILSLTANWLKMVDPKQPFGLPEGTVRAILTMAFIVLVGVLTSFMLSNSQRPSFSKDALTVATGIPLAAANVLEQKFSAEGVVVVIDEVPAAARKDAENAAKEAVAAGKPVPPPIVETRTVRFYPRIDYRQSDEVAKQILTILSTILAAMIGFYFGAKPGESSARTDAPQPQKPDEKAALLAEYNTLKAKPPTLKTVTDKLALADQAKRTLLQPDLDAIKGKLDAADKALSDPTATIETVRTNVATAKAEFEKLADLDKKI